MIFFWASCPADLVTLSCTAANSSSLSGMPQIFSVRWGCCVLRVFWIRMDEIFGSVLINEAFFEGFRRAITVGSWMALRELFHMQDFAVSVNAVGSVWFLTSDEWSFDQFNIILLWCDPNDMACVAVILVLAWDTLVVNNQLAYCNFEVVAAVVLAELSLEDVTVCSRHEVGWCMSWLGRFDEQKTHWRHYDDDTALCLYTVESNGQ